MLKMLPMSAILILPFLCCSCDGWSDKSTRTQARPRAVPVNDALTAQSLVGTWVSEPAKFELGYGVSIFQFFGNGTFQHRLVVLNQSPPGELFVSGTYSLRGDDIVAQYEMPKQATESMPARMDRGDLHVTKRADGSNSTLDQEVRYLRMR
jgi:hypothetical protein